MSNKTIAVINGPNINMLGKRESHIYGSETWTDIEQRIGALANKLEVGVSFFQSNHEGVIVDFIQKKWTDIDGVVINPAAFTKTGYSILDALNAAPTPFVEVHLSNIFARGGWHAESIFAESAIGHVIGFKGLVYDLGVQALVNHLGSR